jgi:two-component system cell cycle sensor histidine kinase/response regulator CckA
MTTDSLPPSSPPDNGLASLADVNCIVLRLDGNGRVIFLNPYGLNLFGFQESEILGRSAIGTIVPEKDRAGTDLVAKVDAMLGQPEDHARQLIETAKKNGERVWVAWSNRGFRNAAGQVMEILSVGHDITDRETLKRLLEGSRVEQTTTLQQQNARLKESNALLRREVEKFKEACEALKENHDQYQLFSKAGTEGILFHENGIAIAANHAFADLFQCPREEIPGMDIIGNFVSPDDIDRVRRKIASNDEQIYTITARSTNGRTFPVEVRSKPEKLAGRSCRVASVRDISHRKQTERQLIQSQKMEAIGTLASGIAHDFNNMLAGIQGNVEVMRNQLPPDSPHQKGLHLINQIVERGAKLSGQLLGYARGGQKEIKEIDLNRMVEDALDMFGNTNRQIHVSTRLHQDTPRVKGDRIQIEQVLLNLMINAAQAMPAGGKVIIETGVAVLDGNEDRGYEITPGTYALLAVSDTGSGMDRAIQKLIFEPFFTTKAKGQGTGLGLASTYGIVKNHKGYIDVQSEPGTGSRFSVLLPAANGKGKPPLANKPEKKSSKTILMIDDEPDFLDLGHQMLNLLGYRPVTAGNCSEAMDRFNELDGTIDLVIIDMIMPGSNVDETIRRFREIDPSVPVLLSSGHSQSSEAGRSLMQICDGFIQKPFRLATLSKEIEALTGAAENEDP